MLNGGARFAQHADDSAWPNRYASITAPMRTWSTLLSEPTCSLGAPIPDSGRESFGSVHGKDGFWFRLRAAQLFTAANPTEGPPVTPRIIISDQAAVVSDSQHRSAVVHVHRSHRVC